jgi:hypothetical protein
VTDDTKLVDQMSCATRADRLLNDEAFIETFETLTAQLIGRWLATRPEERDERERIWNQLYQLGQVKAALLRTIANGKLAARELEEMTSGRPRQHLGVA